MPLLQSENPRIVSCLASTAEILREDHETLSMCADALWSERILEKGPESLVIDVGSWPRLTPSLRRGLIRRCLEAVKGNLRGMTKRHVTAVDALCTEPSGTRVLHLPGVRVRREYAVLTIERYQWRVARVSNDTQCFLRCDGPGSYPLPNGRWLHVAVGPAPLGAPIGEWLDWPADAFPVSVRSRCPGDRLDIGGGATKRVSRLLIDHKVPRDLRSSVPVVEVGGQIALVVGIRAAASHRPLPGARSLHVQLGERPAFFNRSPRCTRQDHETSGKTRYTA